MSTSVDFSTLIPDNIDIQTSETGELVFVETAKPATETSVVAPEKNAATPEGTGTTPEGEGGSTEPVKTTDNADATTVAPTPAAVDWEKRYKDLQSDYTRKSQLLADLDGKLEAMSAKVENLSKVRTPDTEQDTDYGLEPTVDSEEGKLEKLVAKTLEKVLGTESISELQSSAHIKREFVMVSNKYSDFKELGPQIKQVMEKLPELRLNFEQAYLLTKKLLAEGQTATPAKAEATKTASTPAAPKTVSTEEAARLKEKADRLKTEQGVATNPDQKKPVRTLRDCVAASWEEVGANF